MSEQHHNITEREEIELLLPWYATGQIDPADAARVQAYVSKDPEMALQLETIREDMHLSAITNERIAPPSSAALDRLMAQIEQEPQVKQSALTWTSGLTGKLEDFLHTLAPGQLSWISMAAAILIILQASVIGVGIWRGADQGKTYETASGKEEAAGPAFLVKFKPGASFGDITEFLDTLDAQIVTGPQKGNLYKIRVGETALDEASRTALLKRLKDSNDLVLLALPSN